MEKNMMFGSENGPMRHIQIEDGNKMFMAMDMMTGGLEGKTGKELEKAFLLGMIPHHQGAVEMAKKLLEDPTVSQELKDFANKIISAQEGEIQTMKDWLKNY
jgi:uncharacterized protein (DUF305 family)